MCVRGSTRAQPALERESQSGAEAPRLGCLTWPGPFVPLPSPAPCTHIVRLVPLKSERASGTTSGLQGSAWREGLTQGAPGQQRQLQRMQPVEKHDKQHQAQLQVPRAPSWGGSTRGGPSSKPCTPRVASRLGTQAHPVSPLPSLPQAVRQLENSIEKMLIKVHAGHKVTALYLAVGDVPRKVSSSSLCRRPTRSPCQGNEVSKGLLWWDSFLHRPGPPAPLHPLSHCRGPLGLSGVSCCDSLCPRSWPTCLCTRTSCVGRPSCTMGSWKTQSSSLRMPSELLL